MNRKLLSIIVIFVLSLNLCFSAAAAICTGGEGCPHCSSIQTLNVDPSKHNPKRNSACCEAAQPTTCESPDLKPLHQLFVLSANGVDSLVKSLFLKNVIIEDDSIKSSVNPLHAESLLPPLIPFVPIYLQHLSLII